VSIPAPDPTSMARETWSEADLPAVSDWDQARFGAPRAGLLRHLQRSQPSLALVARGPEGDLLGYAAARRGRTATHVGPIVADHVTTAVSLLTTALARAEGPVLVDAMDDKPEIAELLRAAGFAPQRGFTRMRHSSAQPFGRPASVFAIAGPELG